MSDKGNKRAKRSLGQNFLVSKAVRSKIVEALGASSGELVFEIGAGKGAISRGLAEKGVKLVAIETDPGLIGELGGLLRDFENVEIMHSDIRGMNLDAEAERRGFRSYLVAGNIPYYLTSTILLAIASLQRCRRSVLMMQREVAERITAEPGSRESGVLTVFLQSYFRIEKLFRVKPGSFRPVPKVESMVVSLEPDPREGAPAERGKFFDFLKKIFSMRRKKLETIIRKLPGMDVEQFRNARFEGLLDRRPEEIELPDWYLLFKGAARWGEP